MRRLTPYLLLAVLVLGSGLAIGLGLSEAPAIPFGLSDHLELTSTSAVAGHDIKGWLVIDNGGSPLQISHPHGCTPGFGVALSNAKYQGINFGGPCVVGPLLIQQGVTRMPFTISTTYNECRPIGTGRTTQGMPYCLAGGRFPPLPAGRYLAHLVWDSPVPLPNPIEVAVTLLPPG